MSDDKCYVNIISAVEMKFPSGTIMMPFTLRGNLHWLPCVWVSIKNRKGSDFKYEYLFEIIDGDKINVVRDILGRSIIYLDFPNRYDRYGRKKGFFRSDVKQQTPY